jgi:cytochrome c peroxidase
MLVALGKALFWDMQLSSDSRVACASCHFHAGADHRRQNQLSSTKDPVQLNWPLAAGDFPFGFGFMNAGHRPAREVFPRAVSVSRRRRTRFSTSRAAHPNIHG